MFAKCLHLVELLHLSLLRKTPEHFFLFCSFPGNLTVCLLKYLTRWQIDVIVSHHLCVIIVKAPLQPDADA